MQLIRVGSFMTTSGRLRITDPCYDRNTWCAGVVGNCVKGEWEAFTSKTEVEGWGERNTLLFVKAKNKIAVSDWELLNIDVGVDAGMAGTFDEDKYMQNLSVAVLLTGRKEYDRKTWVNAAKQAEEMRSGIDQSPELRKIFGNRYEDAIWKLKEFDAEPVKSSVDFYDVCCSVTLSDVGAGTIEYGALSRSGFGDGSYTAYARKTADDEVAELKIVFISGDELDEDEWEDSGENIATGGTFFLGGKL